MPRKKTVSEAPATEKKSRARTPPSQQYPAWSEARFWGFLRSALRSAYNKWPPKWEVVHAAKRAYTGPGKQQKWEYQCAECKKWHKQKDVQVDHIEPAGTLKCWEDLPVFCQKLFISADGLQMLCSTCHHRKTQEERKHSAERAAK